MRTSLHGEDCRDRIPCPSVKWHDAAEIAIAQHHLNHKVRTQIRVVQGRRQKSQRIDPWQSVLLPRQVRNPVQRLAVPQCQQKLMQWNLGTIAAQHVVYLPISDELLVEVGGRKAAHDDWYIGVNLLHNPGYLQGTVSVWQPMKIDPYSLG